MHPLLDTKLQTEYRDNGWWQDLTLAGIVASQADARPHRPALVGTQTLSYRELDDVGRRAAGGLASRGARPGDIVVVVHATGWEVTTVQLAAVRLGAVVAPLTVKTTARRASNLVRQFSARFLVLAPSLLEDSDWSSFLENREAETPTLETVVVSGPASTCPPWAVSMDALLDAGERLDEELPRESELAIIMATGGTTGPPKAVMQHENAMVYSSSGYIATLGLTDEDVVLGFGPYGHVITTGHMHYMTFLAGATLLPFPRWNGLDAADAIERFGVTYSQMAPAALFDLHELGPGAEEKLATFRLASTGGKPTHFFEAFQERYGVTVIRTYGMTESPGHTMVNPRRIAEFGDTDGTPFDGTEVVVIDPATGDPVPEGVPGEAIVRSPGLFLGYLGRDDLTASVVDSDGFIHTGDLLVRQGEMLKVVGRSKEVIRRGSMNIDPGDIEMLLLQHPSVNEAIAVGIPDERLEERALAVVVVHQGAVLGFDEMVAYLRQNGLPPHSLPEELDVVAAIPRTDVDKYDKIAAREQALARRSSSST